MSKYLEKFNKDTKKLVEKLLLNFANVTNKTQNYDEYVDSIINYINEHSLDYVSRKNDVLNRFEGLKEKLELNNQNEKSQLLQNYLNRLQTIYEKKSPVQKDNLYSYINLIMRLAYSPLKTRVNIEYLKEQFENRYLSNQYGGYDINKDYYDKINQIEPGNTVEIPEVDYNEKTPSISEDEELEEENENSKNDINESKVNNIIMEHEKMNDNIIINNKKNDIIKLDFTYEGQVEKGLVNNILEYLYKSKSKLFNDKDYFNKMPKIYFNYMLAANTRLSDNLIAKYEQVSSDFILFRVLNLFIEDYNSDDASNTKENFYNQFLNINTTDIPNNLLKDILSSVYKRRMQISYLRKIRVNFEKAGIHSLMSDKLIYLINRFLNIHDNVITSLIKIFYIQKGQIEKDYMDKIFINDSFRTNLNFLDSIIDYSNYYIYNEIIVNKNKFTLMRFMNIYSEQFEPIIKYFCLILNYLFKVITKVTSSNKNQNCVVNKYIIDTLYYYSKSERKIYSEIFIHLMDAYIKLIYEFILNGNLIDINDEFFIDNVNLKFSNDSQKIKSIFFFDQNYTINDWVNCFKIRSFSFEGKEMACVPIPFMIDDLHFKILETGKTTFLLKNVKVIDFYSELNRDVLNEREFNFVEKNNNSKKIETDDIIKKKYINDLEEISNNLKIEKNNLVLTNHEINEFKFSRKGAPVPEFITDFQNGNLQNINKIINDDEIDFNDFGCFNEDLIDINNQQKQLKKEKAKDNLISLTIPEKNDSNKEMKNIYKLTIDNILSNTKEEVNKISPDSNIHNIDMVLHYLYINHILKINRVINAKFIDILITRTNIMKNFNLLFNICLFNAGFSMNNFIIELNNYICRKTENENVLNIHNNFFLENILYELSSSPMSDLSPYKDEIYKNIKISFSDNIKSYLIISNEDILILKYKSELPASIFFNDKIMLLYNKIFNYLVKIKRSFALIRNINLDKKLKKAENISENQKTKLLVLYLIEYRSLILNIANNLELYLFHFVVEPFIIKFKEKIEDVNSIDQFINNHYKFLKDIAFFFGLSNQNYLKDLYNVLNLIIGFPILMDRFFMLDLDDIEDGEKQKLYIDIFNNTENFKSKIENINKHLNQMKEKLLNP